MLTTRYNNLTCDTSWHRGAKFYGTKKAYFQIFCLFNPKDSQLQPEYIPWNHSVPTILRLFTRMSHSGTLVDSLNAPMKISVLCQVIQTWNVWCRVARRKFAFMVLKAKLDTNDSMLGKIWQSVVSFFPNSFSYRGSYFKHRGLCWYNFHFVWQRKSNAEFRTMYENKAAVSGLKPEVFKWIKQKW